MSSLYQSSLRRQITEEIYKKPTFELTLEDSFYRGIIKKQRKAGKELRRAMVHGVELQDPHSFSKAFSEDLHRYKRDHSGRTDIFFQVGITSVVGQYPTLEEANHLPTLSGSLEHLQRDLLERYDLRPTLREHMPHATVVLSCAGSPEERFHGCSPSGRRMLNKAKRADLHFEVAVKEDWPAFRQLRYSMSYDKGFSIVPQEQFLALMELLTTEKKGALFLARKNKEIVSGSLCLFLDDQIIYLYGATDRTFGHIGAHYRLTLEILSRAKEQKYSFFDLLGIAPPGTGEDHALAGVTRFKKSLGGEIIVYSGSYDLPLSKRLYKVFKVLKGK